MDTVLTEETPKLVDEALTRQFEEEKKIKTRKVLNFLFEIFKNKDFNEIKT